MSVLKEWTDRLYELVSLGHIILRQHRDFGAVDTPAMVKYKRDLETFLIKFLVAWEIQEFSPKSSKIVQPKKDSSVSLDALAERLKKRFDKATE